MPAPANLVHQSTTTTGTGNLTLSTVNGKQSFAGAFGTGTTTNVFDYFISNQNAAEWEVGTGHMSDATTLVRDTVVASSNSNSTVNFSSGNKDITNDIPAAKQVGTDLTQTLTNKTLTTPVIGSISNTGTITLPTATDTLVGRATTDTLTNKTYDTAGTGNVFKINGTAISDKTGTGKVVLDTSATLTTPVISSITNTGTLTLPTSTDTLVGRATTDTLTNKTLTNPAINGFTGDTSVVNIGSGQFYKDTSGNVGIGTSSPDRPLVVSNNGSCSFGLTDTSTGGNTLSFNPAQNSGGLAQIDCSGANALRFNTNSAERMRIDSSGNVGIGTSSPQSLLDVKNGTTYSSSGTWLARIQQNTNSAGSNGLSVMNAWAATASTIFEAAMGWNGTAAGYYPVFTIDGLGQVIFKPQRTEAMRIDTSGNLLVGYTSSNGSYKLQVNSQIYATNATIATSDGRYKENVADVKNALSLISNLKPATFTWKQHPVHNFPVGQTDVGFIAQDTKTALADVPYADQVVKANTCRLPDDTEEEFLGIADSKLIPLLVAAIKELKAEFDAYKAAHP
jgi:hypothetical protein